MIIIHATLTIDSAKETLFINEISSLLKASRAEEGNISYELTKNTDKENEYKMLEVWENLNAVSIHNTSNHFTSFAEIAKDFLIAPIQINMYEAHKIK
ncbi:putative quinol monooxygenase [Gottfriedia acidiceleris]|uniref:putative quinol monooxygenase n=1 Tax=Gottfriedia acidiceleris TaxID=371036 RepID=UPI002FFD748C